MTTTALADHLGLTSGRVSQLKKQGMPTVTVEGARSWMAKNLNQNKAGRTRSKASAVRESLAEVLAKLESQAPTTDDASWEGMLGRARFAERASYASFVASLRAGDAVLAARYQGLHGKAAEAVATAEKMATDAKRQTGELVHRDDVRALMAEVLVPIRNALDTLPMTERNRCNPQAPEVAEAALRQWRDALLARFYG